MKLFFISVIIGNIHRNIDKSAQETKSLFNKMDTETCIFIIQWRCFIKYFFGKTITNAVLGQRKSYQHQHMSNLHWLRKAKYCIPPTEKFMQFTSLIDKMTFLCNSRLSKCEYVQLAESLQNQVMTHLELSKTMQKIFAKIDFRICRFHFRFKRHKVEIEDELKELYYKLVDAFIENATNMNDRLSEERAKTEVIHREKMNDKNKDDYMKIVRRLENIRQLQFCKYALKTVSEFDPVRDKCANNELDVTKYTKHIRYGI